MNHDGMTSGPSRARRVLTYAGAVGAGLAAAFAAAGCGGEQLHTPADDAAASATPPTLAHLVGQKLVVSMDGATISTSLLSRARQGRIGGVLIHRHNFTSAAQLRVITSRLQQAAAAGGQPRLLIAVDQEGGTVKTISSTPPTLSPARMGVLNSTAVARRQGKWTGVALRRLGVNTDLAPVADVPASTASFMFEEGRTWSFGANTTSRLANAFAVGLRDARALATVKHFPGLGLATRDTDDFVVRIAASRRRLAPGLEPYQRALADGVPMVMLSNAVYDAYDRNHAAGWSRTIGTTLLRRELGFRGVTITDSLDAAAGTRGLPTGRIAVLAARAGTDLLLLTRSEASSRAVFRSLLAAVSAGSISKVSLRASYARIVALKSGL